ncbi:MAG TPA: TonB-dependent receptor [Candidatus Babeliaceae bacterium]|nr:TonB-dependent receptor [Candidatus Babeliaceae bacterium]
MKINLALIILLFLLVFQTRGIAQSVKDLKSDKRNKGIINGNLKDSVKSKPVDLATIAVLQENGKVVSGTVSNPAGDFVIKDLPWGNYYLSISAIGYATFKTAIFNISAEKSGFDLGSIKLTQAVNQLNEVQIKATQQIIKVEPDKIIYSVENDITNRGSSALDALAKAPLISLSGNERITLKGTSDYKVYVNGKPSSLYTNKLAEILRSMPAESIKDIEIITNPSAKYDAEGAGGIINIITQKKLAGGYSGSVYGGINSIGDFSDGIQGIATMGKWNVNFQLTDGKYHRPDNNIELNQENYTSDGTANLHQMQNNLFKSNFLSGALDLNYFIDTLNTLSASVLLYNGNNSTNGTLNSDYTDPDQSPADAFMSNYFRKTHYLTTEINAGYQHNFKRPKQYLAITYRLNYDQPEIYYQTFQQPVSNSTFFAERNNNNEINKESAVQIDYVQPLASNGLLEVGAKGLYRTLNSKYDDFTGDSTDSMSLNPLNSGQLKYSQNVYSGYALYGLKVKQLNLKIGGRLEHTDLNADLTNENNSFKQSYYSFMPSLSISYVLSNQNILRFSYSRRIQRPSLFYLNPYVNQLDPLNISYGNPGLRPEYIDSYEVGYNTAKDKTQFNFILFYQKTNQSIESYRFLQQDSILVSTYNNFGYQANWGLNIYASTLVFEKLSLSGNITPGYYYAQLNSDNASLFYRGFNLKVSTNISYRFVKGLSGLLNVSYYSPVTSFQTRSYSYFYSNVGLTKSLLKDKANLTLTLSQPFNKTSTYRNAYSNIQFYQLTANNYPERLLKLSFRYKFGKTQKIGAVPKKIENNDLKN